MVRKFGFIPNSLIAREKNWFISVCIFCISASGSQEPGEADKAGVEPGDGDKIGVGELDATADAVGEGVGEPCTLPSKSRPAATNKESDVSRFLFIQ